MMGLFALHCPDAVPERDYQIAARAAVSFA